MLSKADILFGKIAVNAGFVTEEQVDECIRIQETLVDKKPLGLLLLEKGYLTEVTLQEVVDAQRQNLQAKAVHTREKRDDSLFGRLVIRFGFATEEAVNECVRIQAKIEEDIFLRLGEIMVKKSYLTLDQVKEVLDYQKTKILLCPGCNTQFNVIMFTPGAKLPCYKCGHMLYVPLVITSVTAEDMPGGEGAVGTPVAAAPDASDSPTPPMGMPAVGFVAGRAVAAGGEKAAAPVASGRGAAAVPGPDRAPKATRALEAPPPQRAPVRPAPQPPRIGAAIPLFSIPAPIGAVKPEATPQVPPPLPPARPVPPTAAQLPPVKPASTPPAGAPASGPEPTPMPARKAAAVAAQPAHPKPPSPGGKA